MISTYLATLLSITGAVFILIAGLGLVRMEDFYTRLHAASKSAPFGVTFLLLGVVVASDSAGVSFRVIVICAFLVLTTPIAAHVIGRAAYLQGNRMESWEMDELEGRYDREARILESVASGDDDPAAGVDG